MLPAGMSMLKRAVREFSEGLVAEIIGSGEIAKVGKGRSW